MLSGLIIGAVTFDNDGSFTLISPGLAGNSLNIGFLSPVLICESRPPWLSLEVNSIFTWAFPKG
jgi:hypothetical protein